MSELIARRAFLKKVGSIWVPAILIRRASAQPLTLDDPGLPHPQLPAGPTGLAIVNAWKGTDGSGATSTTTSIAPSAGSLLFLVTSSYHGDTTGVTDNINTSGTGWTKIGSQVNGGGNEYVSMWYRASIQGGVTSAVVNVASGGGFCTCIYHEVVGLSGTPFTTGEFGKNSGSGANAITTSLTNSKTPSIFFAGVLVQGSSSNTQMDLNHNGTFGAWSYYDSVKSFEPDNNTFMACSVPNCFRDTSVSSTHCWTTASSNWATMIACVG